jgi:hypothetical protein
MAKGGDRFGGFLGGAMQNLATNLAGVAVSGALIWVGLPKAAKLDDPENWQVILIILAVMALASFAGNTLRLAYDRWSARAKIAPARSDRIGILLARLAEDTGGNTAQQLLSEALTRELDQIADVMLWPESLPMADLRHDETGLSANKTAQAWLAEKRCDVLISGRLEPGSKILKLRFTAAQGETSHANAVPLNESMDVPLARLTDLGATIAARAMAQAATAADASGT